jgi:hypothetical protein
VVGIGQDCHSEIHTSLADDFRTDPVGIFFVILPFSGSLAIEKIQMMRSLAGNDFTLAEPGRIDITQSKTVILFLFVNRTFDQRITLTKFNA